MAAAVPRAIVIGAGGRVGNALAAMNPEGSDILVKRGESVPADAPPGPIVVCTRNDVLEDIIKATPADRREDLVFIQNGMLQPFLDAQGIGANTQALIYFAVAKFGEAPTDGVTDLNPEGLTSVTGKHADAIAARLKHGNLACHILDADAYKVRMLEKLIWISAFMLVGARHEGSTVGDVESKYSDEVRSLINELAAGTSATDPSVTFGADVADRLCAYARSVAHFPTAVKEFEWRNGYFYGISQKSSGGADPFPTHTAWLKEVGAI